MKKNILFILQHPAHVHQFKNNISFLKNGYNIFVLAIEKDITTLLLEKMDIKFETLSYSKNGILNKIIDILPQIKFLNKYLFTNSIDLVVSRGNVAASLICGIKGCKHIIFSDSEPVFIDRYLLKLSTKIITPDSYKFNLGKKHFLINSYKELAYLHPNYFKEDIGVYKKLGLNEGDSFYIIRLVSWSANHDVFQNGLNDDNVDRLIKVLENSGKVFITSEKKLKQKYKKYQFKIDPFEIHNALYFSKALICDSQTMATESALLATPAIRINSFVGENDMGNFKELENKYNLIFNYSNIDDVINRINILSKDNNLKKNWISKRKTLLNDKEDMSLVMNNLIKDTLE